MKYKVTKKDFLLFCLYCVILLYFCAIAVLNFSSFAETGEFYGLLPFKAFTPKYLLATIMLFIAGLVLIFTSVSSYIFDKDKDGKFGLHFGEKQSDGYSKWASEKDIKTDKGITKISPKDNNQNAAGIPLINNGNEMWVDNGEYHNLIIGATGSGKTECIVKPLVNILAKNGESMVISDPKGEIYEYCAEHLKSEGYNVVVLNFRNPNTGNAWNPLSLPYQYYKSGNKDKAIELLEDVGRNIICDKDEKDPFWQDSSADYFAGLALGLFEDAKEDEVNLNSINYMSTVGEERRGASNYIKDYFSLKGEESPAYVFASNTINAPNDTKGSILSTFRQKIRLFSTRESLSEMLSYSDFNMKDIGNKKTAVFMIIHDEKTTYHSLMSIFIKQCYETLVDCAQETDGKLKYRTNFILDEFPNMPPLNDVDSMVTAARSRKIRFTFIIQNFSQLDDVYNPNVAQTIKGNCGNLIYLISTEMKALEEISKMCGEVKSKEGDKTASTPLVTVTDLQKMKLFQAIIIRWRKPPFKTQLTPDFKIDWGYKNENAELVNREIKEIKLFDIKKFVSEKKKDETFNGGMFGGGANPFMGGGFNPFMGNKGGFNPFADSKRMDNPFEKKNSPINGLENKKDNKINKPNPFSNLSSSDIDKMVKDIEKKIQELEEEEKNEKKKDNPVSIETGFVEKDNKVVKPETDKIVVDNEKTNKEEIELTQEIKLDDIEKPKINIDKDSIVLNENVVTDDEFYDDFFDE